MTVSVCARSLSVTMVISCQEFRSSSSSDRRALSVSKFGSATERPTRIHCSRGCAARDAVASSGNFLKNGLPPAKSRKGAMTII